MKRDGIHMKRSIALLSFLFALGTAALAELEYKNPDLGRDNSLLFAAQIELPGGEKVDSLFLSDLEGGGTAQLTVYPENLCLIEGGSRLQVQNRFGLFRTGPSLTSLAPVQGYPAFTRGSSVRQGKLLPSAASPDGAFVLSATPSSAAYARLVLFSVAKGVESTVATKVEYSVDEFPARWSPDSRNFVYEKDGSIYYFSTSQLANDHILDEEYRRIGPGKIRCVRWGADGSLFYLKDRSLFRILPAEFFTQALYRGIAGMGVLAGKTPFPFDPNFDDFWVSGDGSRIIFSKGGRSLFLIYLDPDDYGSDPRVTALPYLFLQGDTIVRSVIWPAGGAVTVFTGSLREGGRSSGAYRILAPSDPSQLGLAPAVKQLDAKDAIELVLSPDETKIAVVTEAGVTIRSYLDWSQNSQIKAPGALRALWTSDDSLVVAGSSLIETVKLSTGERKLIALSRVDAFGRSDDGSILARIGSATYRMSAPSGSAIGKAAASGAATGAWVPSSSFDPLPAMTVSASYRVYLDALAAGSYRNNLMIRSIKGMGTRPLFPAPETTYAAFPERDEIRTGLAFDHGSRIRRREVALSFDAIDTSEGLASVLDTLRSYGIKSTFFVNGEFVRQSPGAARLLAGSGHEIGSMFFAAVDATDSRFKIDKDYVRRGLARAEDEWFAATGKELSLLWHTPYYTVSSDIIEAAQTMSYTYVGRDIDPMDWVTRADASRLPGAYASSHEIIERIVKEVKPGSIIPIRLGIPEGGRDDYLYRDLALLIDALIGQGYEIVPISTLIEHAK